MRLEYFQVPLFLISVVERKFRPFPEYHDIALQPL